MARVHEYAHTRPRSRARASAENPLRLLRKFPITLVTLVLISVVIAGCATTASPERDAAPAEAEAQLQALFRQPEPTAMDTLVHRGITVSVPEGYRFEGAYSGDFTDAPRPEGVLFRFRDDDALLSGSVQLVPIPRDNDPTSYMRRYLDLRLDAGELPVAEISLRGETVPAAIVPFPGDGENREILVAFFTFSSAVEDQYGILLEAVYPAGDDRRRGEAAAIAASVEIPRTRASLRWHQRRYADQAQPVFDDESGRWHWVGDVPGGFALRLSEPTRDLYVLVTEPDRVPTDVLHDSGFTIELDHGPWRWALPAASTGVDDRTLYLLIPPDPLRDHPARALVATEPAQAWRDGTYVGTSDFEVERMVDDVQQLVSDHLVFP